MIRDAIFDLHKPVRFENRARYVSEGRPSFRTKAGYVRIYITTDNPRRNKIFWTASNVGLVGLVAK